MATEAMGNSRRKHSRRGGRPTKLTTELQDTICQLILQGRTFTEAICEAGISRTSYWRYRKSPAFARAIDAAWHKYLEEEWERFMAKIAEEKRKRDEMFFLRLKRRWRDRRRLSSREYKRRLERPRDERGRFVSQKSYMGF